MLDVNVGDSAHNTGTPAMKGCEQSASFIYTYMYNMHWCQSDAITSLQHSDGTEANKSASLSVHYKHRQSSILLYSRFLTWHLMTPSPFVFSFSLQCHITIFCQQRNACPTRSSLATDSAEGHYQNCYFGVQVPAWHGSKLPMGILPATVICRQPPASICALWSTVCSTNQNELWRSQFRSTGTSDEEQSSCWLPSLRHNSRNIQK